MKAKRLLSLLLAIFMMAGLLAACDERDTGSNRRDRDRDREDTRSSGDAEDLRGEDDDGSGVTDDDDETATFEIPRTSGGKYEVAERMALEAVGEVLNDVMYYASATLAVNESIKIIPSSDLMELLGLPDIGTIGMDIEAVIDGSDMYMKLGVDALGMSLSAAMWILGDQMLMHFPGLSNYYLSLIDVNDMGFDMGAFAAEWENNEAIIREFGVVLDKTLDKYFALTGDTSSSGSQNVSGGGVNVSADLYAIALDGKLLLGVIEAVFEALLASPNLMAACEDFFVIMNEADPWMFYGYNSFRDLIEDGLDELSRVPASELDFSIGTMNVYVSGNDVVKREFVIEDDWSTTIISYTTLENGSNYFNSFTISFRDNWDSFAFYLNDTGTMSGNAMTGKIDIGVNIDGEKFDFGIDYADVVFHDNGLFSGDIRLVIPVPSDLINEFGLGGMFSGADIKVTVNSIVSGNTMTSTTTLVFLGFNVATIETMSATSDSGRIPSHGANASNIIDINDWRAMDRFAEDIMNSLMAMVMNNNNSFFAELMGEMMYMF